MSKVTITLEDTDIGMVSVVYEIHGTEHEGAAVALSSRIKNYLDSVATNMGEGPIGQVRDVPRIAIPVGIQRRG
ncbi:hypothetical protein GALL_153220 [mine drainage metagenome]|uniref:Uncharacterized protein n=1 Tax=mine drainage metagenome TaxID=410659 RepID=A0A1J5SEY9_9ZZZZ